MTASRYHALEDKDGECRFVFCDPFGWDSQSQSMHEPHAESTILVSLQIGQVLQDANPNGMIYAWADAASPDFLRISSAGGWQSFTRKSARVLWDLLIKQEYRIIAKDQTVAPHPLMGRQSRQAMFVNSTP